MPVIAVKNHDFVFYFKTLITLIIVQICTQNLTSSRVGLKQSHSCVCTISLFTLILRKFIKQKQ